MDDAMSHGIDIGAKSVSPQCSHMPLESITMHISNIIQICQFIVINGIDNNVS